VLSISSLLRFTQKK